VLLQLQQYTLKVNYIKGKHQYIADYLSRDNKGTDDYVEKQCDEEIYELKDVSAAEMLEDIRVSDEKIDETATDPKLQKMMHYTMSGWPTKFNSELNEYHKNSEEFATLW
jgi:hypothetical protein